MGYPRQWHLTAIKCETLPGFAPYVDEDDDRQWHLTAIKCETTPLSAIRQWHLAAMKCETRTHLRQWHPTAMKRRTTDNRDTMCRYFAQGASKPLGEPI